MKMMRYKTITNCKYLILIHQQTPIANLTDPLVVLQFNAIIKIFISRSLILHRLYIRNNVELRIITKKCKLIYMYLVYKSHLF